MLLYGRGGSVVGVRQAVWVRKGTLCPPDGCSMWLEWHLRVRFHLASVVLGVHSRFLRYHPADSFKLHDIRRSIASTSGASRKIPASNDRIRFPGASSANHLLLQQKFASLLV